MLAGQLTKEVVTAYVDNHFNHPHDGVPNGFKTAKACVVVPAVDVDAGVNAPPR